MGTCNVDKKEGRKFFFPTAIATRVALVVIVFLMTLVISPYSVNGDQLHYRAVYSELSSLDLIDGFKFYQQSLSSREVVHFFLSWVSARVVEKDLFVAFINSIFAYVVLVLLKKWSVSFWIAATLVLTNFYILVLYFSAERLKFGVLFFLLSVIYINRLKVLVFFASISVISHVQMLLIYVSMLFDFVIKSSLRVLVYGKVSKILLFISSCFLGMLFLMNEQLMSKFNAYLQFSDLEEMLRITCFMSLALWYSKKRTETVLIFLPLICAVFLVGGSRVNMMGYFVFLYYALQVNRGVNFGVLITSVYYAVASYHYVDNLLRYGDGFYVG